MDNIRSDGIKDLIIGARNAGLLRAGEAYVFNGRTGNQIDEFVGIASNSNGLFGNAVAGNGDRNNDGTLDIIIGANQASFGDGRVWAYSGKNGNSLESILRPQEDNEFARQVAGMDNVNEDGRADFAVMAFKHNVSSISGNEEGRLWVYSGKDGATLYGVNGTAAGDRFGFSLKSIDDVDGDDIGDLLVGAVDRSNNTAGDLLPEK